MERAEARDSKGSGDNAGKLLRGSPLLRGRVLRRVDGTFRKSHVQKVVQRPEGEEMDAYEQIFLARGLATLAFDGPGQGEAEYDFPKFKRTAESIKARQCVIIPDTEEKVSAHMLDFQGRYDPARWLHLRSSARAQ